MRPRAAGAAAQLQNNADGQHARGALFLGFPFCVLFFVQLVSCWRNRFHLSNGFNCQLESVASRLQWTPGRNCQLVSISWSQLSNEFDGELEPMVNWAQGPAGVNGQFISMASWSQWSIGINGEWVAMVR